MSTGDFVNKQGSPAWARRMYFMIQAPGHEAVILIMKHNPVLVIAVK